MNRTFVILLLLWSCNDPGKPPSTRLAQATTYSDSLKQVKEELKDHPNNAGMLYRAGLYAYYSNKYPDAHNYLVRCLEIDSSFWQSYRFLGSIYNLENKLDSAELCLTKVIRNFDGDPGIYFSRAEVRREQKKYSQAIEDYTKAIELDSILLDAINNRGVVYHKTGNWDAACIDFQKAADRGHTAAIDNMVKLCGGWKVRQ